MSGDNTVGPILQIVYNIACLLAFIQCFRGKQHIVAAQVLDCLFKGNPGSQAGIRKEQDKRAAGQKTGRMTLPDLLG
ncbi:hypothetical protein D3C75_1188420 [compost metagenome]